MKRPLTELKTKVMEYLGGLDCFVDVAVTAAYPERQRSFPLKTPVVTVETGGLDLAPAGFGSYLGGTASAYGAAASATLRFGIYCETAENCGSLFEALADALLDFDEVSIIKISCEKTVYDSNAAAYFLSASAEIKAAWILSKPQERLFGDVALKVNSQTTYSKST